MAVNHSLLDNLSEEDLQEALRAKRAEREQREQEAAIEDVAHHLPIAKAILPPAFKATLTVARKELGGALAERDWYFEHIAQQVGAQLLEDLYGMDEDQFNDWYSSAETVNDWYSSAETAIDEAENEDDDEGDDDSDL